MSVHIEHVGLDRDEPVVMLGCFQHVRHFRGETRRRYAQARRHVRLRRRPGRGRPDSGRRFDCAVTHDRALVVRVAGTLLAAWAT